MALLHDATITPGKRDLIKGWLPSRAWFDGDLDGRGPVASFRFDDPAGEVGVECFLMGAAEGSSAPTLLVPMSYRGAPLDGAISGRALYEGRIDLGEAVRLLAA